MARIYRTTLAADVLSTAGDAMLSVADPSAFAPGRLVNGAYALASPLLVVGSPSPGVRAGTYAKTLTFTLSTTQP